MKVLFKNYRELCSQESLRVSPHTRALGPPKGLAAIFVFFCPCWEGLGDTITSLFSALAPSLCSLSWLFVLAMLWLSRRLLFVDGRAWLAAAVIVTGIAVMLAAEQVR